MTQLSSDLLKKRISKFSDTDYIWQKLTNRTIGKLPKAAVLVPLFVREGQIYVWLTERAHHLRNDGGHVAFPGGMEDQGDRDEIETCLRESFEEIGLKKEQVQIVCQLLPRINRRMTLITPVVGIVDDKFHPEINKEEVAAAFYLPLERFLSTRDYRVSHYENRGIHWLVHYFDDYFEGKTYTTWGLSAALCVEIAIAVYQREPDFEWVAESGVSLENPFSLQGVYLQRLEDKVNAEISNSKL